MVEGLFDPNVSRFGRLGVTGDTIMSIDVSQHWAAGGTTTARQFSDRAGAERPRSDRPGSETPAAATRAGGSPNTPAANAPAADTSFGFGDFMDIVNPLHHLPVVGTIYRDISGDEIKPVSRVLGAGVFGGPLGLAGGVASAMIEETTGNDPMGHIYAAVTGRGADVVADRNDAREPRHWAAASGTGPSAETPSPAMARGTEQGSTGHARAGTTDAGSEHWAGTLALGSNNPGAANPGSGATEQLAGVREPTGPETGAPGHAGTVRETVTFFPLGRSDTGPRTVTIDRPGRPSPSPGGASPDDSDAAAGPAAAESTGHGGDGRIDYRTEAVMRAMALGLNPAGAGADVPTTQDPTVQGQNPGGPMRDEADEAPETPASADRWAGGPGGEDIAAAMARALDRYEAQSGT